MSPFTFALLCIHACLVQNAFSQCLRGAVAPGFAATRAYGLEGNLPGFPGYAIEAGRAGPYALEAGLAPGFAYPNGLAGAYGGSGIGDVAVAGEMGVAGTTLVAGQVPILGAVEFGGIVPAAGAVSISGSCGCGGGAPFY